MKGKPEKKEQNQNLLGEVHFQTDIHSRIKNTTAFYLWAGWRRL